MTRYALLLRGVNVGRARQIGMAELRLLLEQAGYQDVATLLRSGNVVLSAQRPAATVARSVQQAIHERFGFPVDVVIRTREQILEIVARDPLGMAAADGAKYLVAFLAQRADPTFLAAIEATVGAALRAGGTTGGITADRYLVDGGELYVWCPSGSTGSPVMAALGAIKGGPLTTVRNWNTLRKLAALLA